MNYHFRSYERINFPKNEIGYYIVSDPDMFDAVYDVKVLDRSHSDGSTIVKQKPVFKTFTVYSFVCKKCGSKEIRSFRKNNIDNHKTLLCQNCLNEERYGSASPFGRQEVKDNLKKIFNEKYGVDHPLQSQEIHDKISVSNIANFGNACTLHDGGECEAKAKKSTMERLGVEYALQNPDIYQKTQDTMISRYGTRFSLRVPEFKAKQKTTLESNFGVTNPMQNPELLAKANTTKLNTYGNMNNWKKGVETRRSIYGRNLNNSKYIYYGINLDSSWELAVWIYCIDNNIPIIRNPISFKYNGPNEEIHSYEPDFSIDGKLVEIKGDQYFKEDGTMHYPYMRLHHDSRELTLEEKEYMNDLYERKHQCGLSNGVEFWKESDCKKYIDYCNTKYQGWNNIYRKDNFYNPSYWCFNIINIGYPLPKYYLPISQQGINPYDINKDKKYHFVKDKGLTPFDIIK